jgi:hypothetical protein
MHRKTRRIAAAVVLTGVVATAACESFLDVNKNPNAPVSARIDLTLPGVIGAFGHAVLSGSLAFWSVEWMQQFSFNGANRAYSNLHRYEVTTIDANSPWSSAYSTVMKESNNIIIDAETTDDWAYAGIAKFLWAWSLSIATDAWGPVPFTEMMNPDIREPKYDEQKVVYEGVQAMIDTAIGYMERQAVRNPGVVDLLYRGDMSKWIKLAHVIKAQSHLRVSNAPGENKTDRANKALTELAKGFTSNADDADFAYPGGNNRRTPWYAIGRGFDGSFYNSSTTINMMAARSDPRIPVFAQPAAVDTPTLRTYRGHTPGSGSQTGNQFSKIGNYFAGDSAALNWVSYSHVKFLEAEARLIVSGAAAADAPYRAAIRANMEKLRIAPADIDAYVNARPALATVPNALEEIMREKYIANFLKLEVWNDWRRTGFPRITPVTSEYLTAIPQRIRTPDSEITSNERAMTATGIPTGLTGMLTKVWWASQTQ